MIDLRTVMPWDKEAVLESVRKTSKVLVLHEDNRTGGFGGEIAATIAEEVFETSTRPYGGLQRRTALYRFHRCSRRRSSRRSRTS